MNPVPDAAGQRTELWHRSHKRDIPADSVTLTPGRDTRRKRGSPCHHYSWERAELASPEIATWDPELTKRVVGFLRPIAKRYFRSEIRRPGPHPRRRCAARLQPLRRTDDDRPADLRGGLLRPVRLRPAAVHTQPRRAVVGPTKHFLQRIGFIPASRDNAARRWPRTPR